MRSRSVVVVNTLVVGLLFAAGCTMPWSKKSGDGGALGLNDPTILENTDIPGLKDELGNLLGGEAPFDTTCQPVQGVKFAPVYFSLDSYVLAPSEITKVEQVAQHLMQNPTHVLIVEGHCDERGSNEYNLSLGENRAISIRARLAQLGVPADRIQTRSYGEEKPAVPGTGEAVWRLNRRGEFVLFQK